jgi:transposase
MFEFTDQAFTGLQPLLPADSRRGRPWRDHHQVLGGILWKVHTGQPWRDVPERFGPWQTCYGRLRRWQADGTWPGCGPWCRLTRRAQPTTAAVRRWVRRRQWHRRARA